MTTLLARTTVNFILIFILAPLALLFYCVLAAGAQDHYFCQIENAHSLVWIDHPSARGKPGQLIAAPYSVEGTLHVDRNTGKISHWFFVDTGYEGDRKVTHRGDKSNPFVAYSISWHGKRVTMIEIHEHVNERRKPFLAVHVGVVLAGTCE